mgnify:CR=1 FL=1
MTDTADVIKSLLVPGSVSFLMGGLAAGVALLHGTEAMRRWARLCLLLLLLLYGAMSTPLGANWLTTPLARRHSQVQMKEEVEGVDTVVVLSVSGSVYTANGQAVGEMGRATALNALEAARLYRLLGRASVIASGGAIEPQSPGRSAAELLREGLIRLGVPSEQIETEPHSRTTREQALFVSERLRSRGIRRFALVTDGSHMPRAIAAFRQLGLQPIASTPPIIASTPETALGFIKPSVANLRLSEWAAYEYMAWAYYGLRGWSESCGGDC